jgi:hypothetical protein
MSFTEALTNSVVSTHSICKNMAIAYTKASARFSGRGKLLFCTSSQGSRNATTTIARKSFTQINLNSLASESIIGIRKWFNWFTTTLIMQYCDPSLVQDEKTVYLYLKLPQKEVYIYIYTQIKSIIGIRKWFNRFTTTLNAIL